MKIIFKDKSEITISSSSNSYFNMIGESEAITLRIDNPTITVDELIQKLTLDNLSSFTIQVDDSANREYSDYTLIKIVDTLSDQVNSIEITLNKLQ